MRTAYLKQHDLCVYRTRIQSLLLQSVKYTGTSRRLFTPSSTVNWHKQTTVYPWFNSTPTTISEHRGGLDCVSRHSRWFSLVALKGFTVHSRRPHSRQDKAQSISNDYQSNHEKHEFNQSPKYFEILPSQPRNIENYGGDSVNCPEITKDKSSESRVRTPDIRLIIATSAVPRREPESRVSASLQYQDVELESRVSSITTVPRRRESKPASLLYRND